MRNGMRHNFIIESLGPGTKFVALGPKERFFHPTVDYLLANRMCTTLRAKAGLRTQESAARGLSKNVKKSVSLVILAAFTWTASFGSPCWEDLFISRSFAQNSAKEAPIAAIVGFRIENNSLERQARNYLANRLKKSKRVRMIPDNATGKNIASFWKDSGVESQKLLLIQKLQTHCKYMSK